MHCWKENGPQKGQQYCEQHSLSGDSPTMYLHAKYPAATKLSFVQHISRTALYYVLRTTSETRTTTHKR